MARLSSTSPTGGERTDAIDHCLAGIARLSHEVTDASQHLPAYDQRTYAEAVKALSEKLETVRAGLAPRPKFTFRGQLKARGRGVVREDVVGVGAGTGEGKSSGEASSAVDGVLEDNRLLVGKEDGGMDSGNEGQKVLDEINARIREEKATIHKPVFSSAPQILLSNHSEANIHFTPYSAPADSSSNLRNLTSCVVDLTAASPSTAPLAGLTLRDVSRSVIVCGVISGPIHITNMTDSILVVSCRQFRMHECKNVDVYLHCGSKPIVEDVEVIKFAPLPDIYVCQIP
jgi:tubulin-specific chaperone C